MKIQEAINVMEKYTDISMSKTVIEAHNMDLTIKGSAEINAADIQGAEAGIVAVGEDNTLGLRADGTVLAIGDNDEGQCEVSDWTDIVAISASDKHVIGLKSDGTVVTAGKNYYGECSLGGWSDMTMPADLPADLLYNYSIG